MAVSVSSSDIAYVEGRGRDCVVHTDEDAYPVLQSLNMFSEALPESFFRCHRNFSVNLAYIETVGAKDVLLKNGASVKLEKAKQSALQFALEDSDI